MNTYVHLKIPLRNAQFCHLCSVVQQKRLESWSCVSLATSDTQLRFPVCGLAGVRASWWGGGMERGAGDVGATTLSIPNFHTPQTLFLPDPTHPPS
jgi:hypothetical protein